MKRNALLFVFPLLLAGCFKKTTTEISKEAEVVAVVNTPSGEHSATVSAQQDTEPDTKAKA